jgi:predicted transposase YbfD/YdcC
LKCNNIIVIHGVSSSGLFSYPAGYAVSSPYCHTPQINIARQCAVDSKSNEITAIPVLLVQLALTGSISASMRWEPKVPLHSRLPLSKPTTFSRSKFQATAGEGVDYTQHQQCEAGHHRIESRTVLQFPAAQVFTSAQCKDWAGLQSLVVVQSDRRLWNKDTPETRYFLSSLAVDAVKFARYIRAHWGIENQLHWCLDVVFNEDAARVRKGHAPRNFSLLRRFALNLLRQDTSKGSLAMKRYKAGLDDQFMLQILTPLLSVDEA